MNTIKKILRPSFHFLRSYLYAILAGMPAKKLQIIAITGTDGKTSTCMMTYKMLVDRGLKVGLATTVWMAYPGEEVTRNISKMSSIPPRKMQSFFRSCVKKKADLVVVEASSIGLHQYRMAGMRPFVAAVTNITREELAYHGDMKHYERAKKKIIKRAEHVVIPMSLRHWKNEKQDFVFYDKTNIPAGILKVAGDFNYENAAIVYEIAKFLRIKEANLFDSLANYEWVTGRMQKIPDESGRNIYVDYAVTPAAFEAVHQSIQDLHPNARVIHVFWATGWGRDAEKRPLNGWVASKYAHSVILTDEESYGEPVEDIIADIASGIPEDTRANIHKIPDRLEAIKHALILAEKGDAILITGMWGEMTRNVSGEGDSESQTTKKMWGKDIEWEEEKIVEQLASEIGVV